MFLSREPINGEVHLQLNGEECDVLSLACCEAVHRMRANPMIADEATIQRLDMMITLFALAYYATRGAGLEVARAPVNGGIDNA